MVATRNRLPADLVERVGECLTPRVPADIPLWVGLSGGCDSVVLLHVLTRLGVGARLSAIHVHHGLSPNADQWVRFCSEYCAGLRVPLQVCHVDVNRASGGGIEAAAREARYAAFTDYVDGHLLLAHHRGDQAETVLFNLLRGCGVAGAAGMPVERRFGRHSLIRPMLGISRQEIENYARTMGLRWIDDESNGDLSLTRNFLRHEALGAVRQRFPAAESSLAQAAVNFGEAVELVNDLAHLDWQQVSDGDTACLAELRMLSDSRLKNLLRYRLHQLGWLAPVATRLDEFVRQIRVAGPDRHPELVLPDGTMRVAKRRLCWVKEN